MEVRGVSDDTLTPKTETSVHSLRSSDLKDTGHKNRRTNNPEESGIRWFLQFCQLTVLREFPGLREDKGNWAEVSGLELRVWGMIGADRILSKVPLTSDIKNHPKLWEKDGPRARRMGQAKGSPCKRKDKSLDSSIRVRSWAWWISVILALGRWRKFDLQGSPASQSSIIGKVLVRKSVSKMW